MYEMQIKQFCALRFHTSIRQQQSIIFIFETTVLWTNFTIVKPREIYALDIDLNFFFIL